MEKLTYKQAFDKITEAYIKGEIQPYNPFFCFCGTLCDGSNKWQKDKYKGIFKNDVHNDFMFYTGKDYADMERALLIAIYKCNHYNSKEFEENLFVGMCAALDVLKQIHKDRGENVEDFQFTKREPA